MRIRPITLALWVTLPAPGLAAQQPSVGWAAYGGDADGSRYSPLADISRTTVGALRVAWTYRTGHGDIETRSEPRFETTPIVVDGTLYLTTPLGPSPARPSPTTVA